ncbi:hypothetical protein BN873_150308 [Candidatus Competibacter denitrificans Run_A_D11]|uniref:Uncharacterized protein n=1 Tax=Candidatus Competibacter denitrificans Run_A_D11 TaxID=1400863 RepID=W6M747_9GAMM|nr:hypothetical protein [Candidatus Competibacter denitrificans]CDI01520.1 hypothetical protein BN873_150308 [Candidatus Competibacter denitrificans Run_A_D11]HRC68577.1 hypothetical protein [Candidatus Competibacter denitrificans]
MKPTAHTRSMAIRDTLNKRQRRIDERHFYQLYEHSAKADIPPNRKERRAAAKKLAKAAKAKGSAQ